MKIESEIERINFSSKDELALEKINYDKNSIKNLNFDFNNLVINKPWGYEYLFYSSKEISIWILNIKKNQKTSMHCHPNKKTSLVLLDGEANFYSLNKKIHIKSGQCVIMGGDADKMDAVLKVVDSYSLVPEVGDVYDAEVVKMLDFGAFVRIAPGKEGLVHISEIALERVNKVEDHLKMGQKVTVKLIKIDDQGRVNFSIKALLKKESK